MDLFEEVIKDIHTEYHHNANDLGWRFLNTSKRTLEKNNGILLLTLNPGGDRSLPDQPMESCEDGCAYLTETWGKNKPPGTSKLQRQFQFLFKEIGNSLGVEDYKKVIESSVCGHFTPFRSPTKARLKDKERSIKFSKNLWMKILLRVEFKIIFCIDKNTYKTISSILLSMAYKVKEENEFPIAWGKYKSLITSFERNNKTLSLVWFPHLSTFSIFGREKSKEAVSLIITQALKDFKRKA